jgi:hypothetical protein
MAEESVFGKVLLTAAVIVAAIPGLVVEPGPVSEVVALGALAAIWLPGSEVGDKFG